VIQSAGDKKSRNYRAYMTNALGIFVILLLGWYLYQNQDILDHLKKISWEQILLIVLLDLVSFLLNGFLDKSMINRFDPRVSFLDCYLLGYANNFLNKILPTIGGGAAFRAVYLKKKYKLSYSQFISTVAGLYVISFFPHSVIGIICLLVIYSRLKVFNWLLFLAFLGIFIFCLSTIVFSPRIPASQSRVFKFLSSIFEGWNILKNDPKFILIYVFLSVAFLFISAIQTFFSYQALGIKTDITSMLFLSALGIILAFINFTPDGIGVKEGVYIFSAKLVQIPGNILVLGSLVLRGISICTTFIIGGISYLVLMRQLKALEDKRE
jgi:uncharacterized membrane protein YbhN (UPF0104 family)